MPEYNITVTFLTLPKGLGRTWSAAVSLGWCEEIKFGEYIIGEVLSNDVLIITPTNDWETGPSEFVEWVKGMEEYKE